MNESSDIFSLFVPADALQALRVWLRSERQRMGWTQSELARRSGVPATSISRLEQTGLASTESLFKVVFALDQLESFHEFLKERQRLSSIPRTLQEPLRTKPVLRVRMRKGAVA